MSEAEPHALEVPPGVRRERADKVLAAALADFSRSQVQRLFADGRVWRDDTILTKSDRVGAGDTLVYSFPPVVPLELRPVAIPLEILYEDEDLLAVNKVAGMVVHPGAGTGEDTLVHALLHHCAGGLSGIGGVERPGIVHRLDRETSGVILVGKSDRGFRGLSKAFAERTLEKNYVALVRGRPAAEAGSVEAPIGRHPVHRTRMAVRPEGRPALTDWAVEARWPSGFARLRLRLHTGRTHQIRVHCAHLGWPLAGDPTYGFKPHEADPVRFPRVMLHAARLRLAHPVTGVPMELEAPLPDDFSAAMIALSEA